MLALVFVVGNMAFLLPGAWGEWIDKVMPGNAGSGVADPGVVQPDLLGPWMGFAVFAGEVAVLLLVALAGLPPPGRLTPSCAPARPAGAQWWGDLPRSGRRGPPPSR